MQVLTVGPSNEIHEHYNTSPKDEVMLSNFVCDLRSQNAILPMWKRRRDLMGLKLRIGFVRGHGDLFAGVSETARFHGYFGDVLTTLSAAMNFTFEVSSYSTYGLRGEDSLLSGLVRGEIDVAADVVSITGDRAAFVDFAMPLYKEQLKYVNCLKHYIPSTICLK